MTTITRRMSRRLVAVIAGVALAATACSGSDGAEDADAGEDSSDEAGAATEAQPADVEQFTGSVDEFYDVPDPLPAGDPGDLIRTMPLEAPTGQTGVRIMYHSTDAQGDDRAVTGVVYHPTADPPDGGWPVVAWAHGTSGIAAPCAPSRVPMEPPAFGIEGVRVATDYIGLGPTGELHPYLSAAAEGHAVIDGVAAARALEGAHAGDRWVVAGHSQGGHAALVTGERAAERLPDAELLGTLAVAPGAELSETFGDDVQTRIITTMVLFGAASEDPDIDPADYLSPDAHAAAAGVVEDECLGTIINTMLPFSTSPDFYVTDPRDAPETAEWLDENDPGQVVSPAPVMVAQGGRDAIVVPDRTASLVDRLCGLGQVLTTVDLREADHDTIMTLASDDMEAWLADRFAGEPAPDDCDSTM